MHVTYKRFCHAIIVCCTVVVTLLSNSGAAALQLQRLQHVANCIYTKHMCPLSALTLT